jgi:hypothetical protein
MSRSKSELGAMLDFGVISIEPSSSITFLGVNIAVRIN